MPIAAAIVLAVVYQLARRWYDANVALLATAFVRLAFNPAVLEYHARTPTPLPTTGTLLFNEHVNFTLQGGKVFK